MSPRPRGTAARVRQFLDAAALLHLNGLVSDGERALIHRRMLKWKQRQEAGKPKR